MTTTTVVYCDVDGVINAYNGTKVMPEKGHAGWDTWAVEKVAGFFIRYSPDLLRRLEALAARPDVKVKWLTTWTDSAPSALCPGIGLAGEEWEVVPRLPKYSISSIRWWKLQAIRDDWTEDKRIVWIDDDLKDEPPAYSWLNWICGDDDSRALDISPQTHLGITRDEMDRIERFVG